MPITLDREKKIRSVLRRRINRGLVYLLECSKSPEKFGITQVDFPLFQSQLSTVEDVKVLIRNHILSGTPFQFQTKQSQDDALSDRLAMRSCKSCTLGYLFGNYFRGRGIIFPELFNSPISHRDYREAIYGFDIDTGERSSKIIDESGIDADELFDLLDEEVIKILTEVL